jgi:hypothetical protein
LRGLRVVTRIEARRAGAAGDRGLVRLEDDIFIADTRVCHEGQVHLSPALATVDGEGDRSA